MRIETFIERGEQNSSSMLIGRAGYSRENPRLVVGQTLARDFNLPVCIFVPGTGEFTGKKLSGVADLKTTDITTFQLSKLLLDYPEIQALETATRGIISPFSEYVLNLNLHRCSNWDEDLKNRIRGLHIVRQAEAYEAIAETETGDDKQRDLNEAIYLRNLANMEFFAHEESLPSEQELIRLARSVVYREMPKYMNNHGILNKKAIHYALRTPKSVPHEPIFDQQMY